MQREVKGGVPPTALKSTSKMLALKTLKHDYSLTYMAAELWVERMD